MISSVYAEEEVVKAAHGSGAGERLFLALDGLLLRVYEWKSSEKPLTAHAWEWSSRTKPPALPARPPRGERSLLGVRQVDKRAPVKQRAFRVQGPGLGVLNSFRKNLAGTQRADPSILHDCGGGGGGGVVRGF